MEDKSNDMVITQSDADLVNGLLDRIEYIAKLNPKGVRKLAYSKGYRSPEGLSQRKQFLMQFLNEGGDDASSAMMLIHPDREILVESLASKVRQYNGDQFDYNAYDGADDYDSFIAAIANAIGGVAGAAKSIVGPSGKQMAMDQANNQNAVMQQAIAYKQKQEEEKNKTKRVIIWGSVAVFLLIVIVVSIWLYTSRKK